MHSAVSFVAQDGLYVLAGLAVLVWLMVPRPEKAAMAVEMVVGLVTVAALVKVAGAVHTDPRPFVQDPAIRPWFSHPPDNGFPSDHTAVAVMTSVIVLCHRRTAGLVLLAIGVSIGLSRVTAHVHHLQDVAAGGVIGLAAAVVGVLVWRAIPASAWVRRVGRPESAETASRHRETRP